MGCGITRQSAGCLADRDPGTWRDLAREHTWLQRCSPHAAHMLGGPAWPSGKQGRHAMRAWPNGKQGHDVMYAVPNGKPGRHAVCAGWRWCWVWGVGRNKCAVVLGVGCGA
eukprot:354622-Chlamydomonas_euryale.AAC.18